MVNVFASFYGDDINRDITKDVKNCFVRFNHEYYKQLQLLSMHSQIFKTKVSKLKGQLSAMLRGTKNNHRLVQRRNKCQKS